MPEFYKGDDEEKKWYNSAAPILSDLGTNLDQFFADAYESQPFGDLIYEGGFSPLTNAIKQSIFRDSFNQIFDAFARAGTFESYITVFKKIFGETVQINFEVPGPGQLNIDILAEGIELSHFVARSIVSNDYVFDNVITQTGDKIVFQTIKGFQTQYELEQMLTELIPVGIYSEITLTLGV